MEEKVEQQTEARDMTERVEEMLSAIDAACMEIDRQTEGEPALTPEAVADVGAQLATDLAAETTDDAEPASSNDAGVLNAEQSELADADAGFLLEDLMETSEPEKAVEAAAEALHNAVESADDLTDDIAAIAGALAEFKADEGEPVAAATSEGADPSPAPQEQPVADSEPGAANVPQSIEELDSELASLADAAMDGAFEDAAGLQAEATAPPARVASVPAEATAETMVAPVDEPATEAPDPGGAGSRSEPSSRAAEAPVGASPPPGVQPVETPVRHEPLAPVHLPSVATAASQPAPGRFAGVARALEPTARKVWLAARPTLASAVVVISKPAEKLSASKRDTIGWFAVYTAFLALCVWGFLLLFRKPSVPVPTSDPVGILGEQPAPADS